ncbi:MAG: cytochrome c family protein [Acetobacteraceae bacterium]|nr:cytochrome c family protein [Acetobacteraceae bacterium]
MSRLRPILAVLLLAATPAVAGDAVNGAKVFKTQCSVCHRPEIGKNLIGPSMFGIVGRKSGSVAGFKYSAANQAANLTWDAATLDKYLINPRETVPGTTMSYAGLKNETQRADLIAYLETLK